jgi:hypothetical protein
LAAQACVTWDSWGSRDAWAMIAEVSSRKPRSGDTLLSAGFSWRCGKLSKCDGKKQKAESRKQKRDGKLSKCDGKLLKRDGKLSKCDGKLLKRDGKLLKCDGKLLKRDGTIILSICSIFYLLRNDT